MQTPGNNSAQNTFLINFVSYSQFYFWVQRYAQTHDRCEWVSAYDITIHGEKTTLLNMWDMHCEAFAEIEANYFVDETKKYLYLIGSVN